VIIGGATVDFEFLGGFDADTFAAFSHFDCPADAQIPPRPVPGWIRRQLAPETPMLRTRVGTAESQTCCGRTERASPTPVGV
jgi:hypothetical protein